MMMTPGIHVCLPAWPHAVTTACSLLLHCLCEPHKSIMASALLTAVYISERQCIVLYVSNDFTHPTGVYCILHTKILLKK